MSPQVSPAMEQRNRASSLNATVETGIAVRSKIWMPYGDIILQVVSTQFRVNRDVLAKHSSVFRDLFSVPQPVNEPTTDGCHTVQLYDNADDWAELLAVLYEPFQRRSRPQFNTLAAMLRLGKKYDFLQPQQDAVSRIRYEFPSDFKAFNDLEADMTKIKYRRGIYCDLLNLAFECGIYSSVPLLAFCCLRENTLEALFEGVERDDDSRVTFSGELKINLALAFGKMALFQHRVLCWLRNDSVVPGRSCPSATRCTQQRNAMACVVDRDHGGQFNLGYTIDQWDERWTGMLCPVCEETAVAFYELNRAKGWELLPTFFGLAGWKDLKDDVDEFSTPCYAGFYDC
ncbi:hypothetical protein B0H16DRAFT_1892196 [Mycena metata]|uniref:BTB domain-containing protein n=1 Tax=Mycena metata TaxID=1033252 RepID=A0AAD7I746_9AGAR|nr:hypothetical protein B0H16DRAFT_1892196 [Mycena metata]